MHAKRVALYGSYADLNWWCCAKVVIGEGGGGISVDVANELYVASLWGSQSPLLLLVIWHVL